MEKVSKADSRQSQQKTSPINSMAETKYSPQTPNDKILQLQQTLGNQAVMQMMRQGTIEQAKPKSSSFTLNSLSMSPQTPSRVTSIQRRLNTTSGDLSGKQARSGLGKVLDNAAMSTFRAIEKALDEYHTIDADDNDKRETQLLHIIALSKKWLSDGNHIGPEDVAKQASLKQLEHDANFEVKRIKIIKDIGVPRLTVDKFDERTVNNFYAVVLAFRGGNGKAALDLFETHQAVLKEEASLVRSLMKRNQIDKIDPTLAASMNNPNFTMTATAGSQDAINLIKKQAQEKIHRFEALQAEFTAAQGKLMADLAKPKDQQTLKQSDFPILTGGTAENKEFTQLKAQQGQYKGIVDGSSIAAKKKEKEFSKFSDSELFGLMGYTSNLYGAINSPLRFDVGDDTKFTAGHRALAGSITSALHKLKPYKGTVYKHGGDFPGYASVNVPGAIVSDMAPNSTAKNQKGPANAGENHEVLEILTSKTGRDVSNASVFGSGEEEVLFAPGTRFRVIAAFERNKSFWDSPHDVSQWAIQGQQNQKYFKQAMAAVAIDTKKDKFHRVVFKEEV